MRRIFLTGASGFVGQELLTQLIAYGHEIHILGRGDLKKVEGSSHSLVRHHKLDIYDDDSLDQVLTEFQATDLIHLAWGGLPDYKNVYHLEFELPNQMKFLARMLKHGVKNISATGTCFEYGLENGKLDESLTCNPQNSYGIAKLTLLKYLEQQKLNYDFRYNWNRLFYLYGENQNPKSIYKQLLSAAAQGKSTFDMSLGHQLRDFLPIEEAVRKILGLHFSDSSGGVFNICSAQPVSILQMVEKWIQENNLEIDLNLGVYGIPDYEPLAFWGSDDKIKTTLD